MFNAKNFIIDKVRRVTQVNLTTDAVDWTATSIESPQVEFTGESTDKTDAQGVLLARFDTAKGVNFSGEVSTLHLALMGAQRGTEVQVGSESAKLKGKTFEVLTVTDGKATLTYEPSVVPTCVYTLSQDKNIEDSIAIGTEDEQAKYANQVITMPENFAGTKIGVLYEYETSAAVKVSDNSEQFAEAAQYIVDILAADVCNPSIKRAGSLVFPKAKIDNNFTLNLTTEGTHPFSFSALKDYCSDDAELCYILFHE
jgi:hypothetical protein